MSAAHEFIAAIQAAGLTPPENLIPDGKLHRFASNGKRGDDAGWYVFHDDGIPAGAFGDWRGAPSRTWRADIGRRLTPAEEAAHQRKVDAMDRAREAEKARRHAEAREKATAIWQGARPAPDDHAYLLRKGVKAHGLRLYRGPLAVFGMPCDGSLIVPAGDGSGAIHTLQFIHPEKRGGDNKRFLPGGDYRGRYFSIGTLHGAGPVCICEGYATGASIHEATDYPVVVAFNAGNLLPVAQALRARFPNSRLILCADDDAAIDGPGLPKATEAARSVGGRVAVPDFGPDRPEDWKDFNDLAQHLGLEAVAECIRRQACPKDGVPGVPGARRHTEGEKVPPEGEPRPGNGADGDQSHVILTRGDTMSVKPIRWTWDGYLARSKLQVLAGAIGTGKSTIAIDFAAVVTAGGRWPDGTKCDPGDVLVWSDEDDPEDTLLPRFLAAGGDPRRIHFVTGTVDRDGKRHFDPATDITGLIAAARDTTDLGLVLVDPVVTVVAGDSHKNTEVRRALRPLVGLASDLDAAVLGVSHHTKGTAGRDPVERITGSLAFGALPRVTMGAARDGSDPERRIFCRTKSNIGPDTGGWEYRLALTDVPGAEGVRVVVARWGEHLEGSAKELLASAEATGDPEERGKLDDASDWLRELLKDGPVDSKQVRSDAKQAGIAQPTVERAKVRLGVKVSKAGYQGKWRWSLPEHSGPENGTNHQQLQNDDHLWKPTPLKPSCGAGSTKGDQAPEDDPPSTSLKPSCGAGSTKGDQAPEKKERVDHLCSNLGVARVPGVFDPRGAEGVDHLCSNLGAVRVSEDRSAKDDQGFEVVGEKGTPTGGADLICRVVITIGEGPEKRSFETSAPAGLPLADWQSRVLKAYGPGHRCEGWGHDLSTAQRWGARHDQSLSHGGLPELLAEACVPAVW
jgi:putative DNA primase/helicase